MKSFLVHFSELFYSSSCSASSLDSGCVTVIHTAFGDGVFMLKGPLF